MARASAQYQRGFAIVLLLWMLSAMALTVSAIVHFARGDTAMADLRREEAQAYWLGRGLARLALWERQQATNSQGGDITDPAALGNDSGSTNVNSTARYDRPGVSVTVALFPADGLLSLNTASPGELSEFLAVVGGLEFAAAEEVALVVDELRSQTSVVSFDAMDNPGFQYVEELMAVPGMTRNAYDALRDFVHVERTGALQLAAAPPELKALLSGGVGGEDADPEMAEAAPLPQNQTPGFQAAANQGGLGGTSVWVARLAFDFESGARYQQTVILPDYNAGFSSVRRPRRVVGVEAQ
jgi:type II secretory pathway component PulK